MQQEHEEKCDGPMYFNESECDNSASDGKQCVVSKKFLPKSSFQNQAGSNLTLENFISIDGDMAKNCFDIVDIAPECGLTVYAALPFDLTMKTRNLESIKLQRSKTSSADVSSYFLARYAAMLLHPQKAIFSPTVTLGYSWKDKKSSPVYLDEQGSVASSEVESSEDGKESSFMDSPSSSSRVYVLANKPAEEMARHVRWLSGSNMSDHLSVSCTTGISTYSYRSELYENYPLSKGLLRRIWKNGVPYYAFLVAGDTDVIYVASPWKVNKSENDNIDYVYMFHAGKNRQKREHAANASRFVGKMKVSSCLSFSHNGSKVVETECVLLGSSEDCQKKTKTAITTTMRHRGLSKNLKNMFMPQSSNSRKSTERSAEINVDLESFCHPPSMDELNNMHPGLELAAVVVRNHKNDSKKNRTVGGWGLKFLEKIVDSDDHSSADLTVHPGVTAVENGVTRSLNVFIPAGLHGTPLTEAVGASSLVERWRTGGQCDCGGWDVGCPLAVLQSRTGTEDGVQRELSHNIWNIVDLFREGGKQEEPSFSIMNIQQDLYEIYFQPKLSELQSFSIGLAQIHTQTPSLCPDF